MSDLAIFINNTDQSLVDQSSPCLSWFIHPFVPPPSICLKHSWSQFDDEWSYYSLLLPWMLFSCSQSSQWSHNVAMSIIYLDLHNWLSGWRKTFLNLFVAGRYIEYCSGGEGSGGQSVSCISGDDKPPSYVETHEHNSTDSILAVILA